MGTRTVDVVNQLQMIRLPRLYVVAAGLASEVLQACHAQSASALVSSIFELRFENQASIRERCRVTGISPEARDMCESDWCVVSTRKEGAMHVSEV